MTRECASRHLTYLICHMTLQDQFIKGFFDFMERSCLVNVATLQGLVAIRIVVVEIMFLIYHVASHDHMLKGSNNIARESFSY